MQADAYCGPAPIPDNLIAAWSVDVVALGLCAALVLAHLRTGITTGRMPLAGAVCLLVILFMSPLCALTVALFSARIVHHALLIGVAAPLLALAFSEQRGLSRRLLPLPLLVAIHAAILWLWHAPQVYEAAIRDAVVYWTMQISLLASAFALWRRLLSGWTEPGPALLALLATVVQMGMLGALLVFSREALYAPHFTTTLAYGLTPIDDQQLGGLVMWVPAALPYLVAAAFLLASMLGRPSVRTGQ